MKQKMLFSMLIATFIAVANVSANADVPNRSPDLYGNAAPLETRQDLQIVVSAATRYINVSDGSIVRFVVGDRHFVWHFETKYIDVDPFDLGVIAPAGLLNHSIKVYVARNPINVGG